MLAGTRPPPAAGSRLILLGNFDERRGWAS